MYTSSRSYDKGSYYPGITNTVWNTADAAAANISTTLARRCILTAPGSPCGHRIAGEVRKVS